MLRWAVREASAKQRRTEACTESEKLATGGGRETAAKKPHNKRTDPVQDRSHARHDLEPRSARGPRRPDAATALPPDGRTVPPLGANSMHASAATSLPAPSANGLG